MTISEWSGRINDDDGQILGEAGVLVPIIHYGDFGAIKGHHLHAGKAVLSNPAFARLR